MLCPGEYSKPEYAGHRVFIDVLCVPQENVKTEEVVKTTHLNYTKCWITVFVGKDYLNRAWCCLEIAAGTNDDCRITVIGSCDAISDKDFFDNIDATNKSDIKLIKKEILKLFQTKEKFNGIVARAMEVLFVAALKKVSCDLLKFDCPSRADRQAWRQRLPSLNPTRRGRNKQQDWDILTGNLSSSIPHEPNTKISRVVKVFLASTFSDTVLEWNLFHQDVVPYLKLCARNRGIDLVFVDIRFGNRDEDALREEIVIAELERCKMESCGMFFILLTGNKYGFRRAPAQIPKTEFESLIDKMSSDECDYIKTVYALDENQLDAATKQPAPEYIRKELLPMRDESQAIQNLRCAAQKLWSSSFER